MKALAAPHNQQAISQLIFHPAIVMSSAGAGIIHNSPVLWQTAARGQGGIWTLSGPMSSSRHLCWSNRSGLVGGSCETGSGIKHEIGQAYLNTMRRHKMNGFLALVGPQRFPPPFYHSLPSHYHDARRYHLSSAGAFISKKSPAVRAAIITVIYKILSIRYWFHCRSRVDGPIQKWAGDLWNLTNAVPLCLCLSFKHPEMPVFPGWRSGWIKAAQIFHIPLFYYIVLRFVEVTGMSVYTFDLYLFYICALFLLQKQKKRFYCTLWDTFIGFEVRQERNLDAILLLLCHSISPWF